MKLEAFHPYILTEVLGCPEPTMNMHLVSAAAEFCRETLAWTEVQDPVALQADVSDYEMDMPAQAYALTMRDVWLGSRRLRPMTLHGLQDAMPDWQTQRSNEPVYYNMARDRNSVSVFPIPNASAGALVMRMAFCPTASATTLPDFLGQEYMEVIASGAKARLMLMPGQSWANPQLGAYHRQQFDNGILNARIEEAHDRVPGTITVQPRRFGF